MGWREWSEGEEKVLSVALSMIGYRITIPTRPEQPSRIAK